MSDANRPGLIPRFWNFLWSPSGAYSLGLLLIVGFIAGILFWGGFHWAMEATNNEDFCVSCHEMNDNVYAEYKGTVHQNNSSGVRATCPDCHVPKEWGPKVIRKIQATGELWGHFVTGVINTPEKFEEHRIEMASSVWRSMKRTDSRECRNCHDFGFMDFTKQENRAADDHQRGFDAGKTCIDCHQGVAHRLPAGYLERYEEVVENLAAEGALPPPAGKDVASAGVMSDLKGYFEDRTDN